MVNCILSLLILAVEVGRTAEGQIDALSQSPWTLRERHCHSAARPLVPHFLPDWLFWIVR